MKVFGIGFNKTGTTSLAAALARLGLKVAPQPPAVRLLEEVVVRRELDRLFEFCRRYEAFQDIPFSLPGVFRSLDSAFPGSRFVLTVRRTPDEWFDSLFRFTTRLYQDGHEVEPSLEAMDRFPVGTDFVVPKVHRWIFGADRYGLFNRARYLAVYEEHNQAARDHFRDRPADMLELDVAEPDASARLAGFLGLPDPGTPMPHINRSG